MTRGSSLHDCSDDRENSGKDQIVAATDLVSDKAGAQSPNKTTALEGGNNVGLKVGKCNTRDLGETISTLQFRQLRVLDQHALRDILLLEGGHGQDTADDARVHTEKHATEASLSLSAVGLSRYLQKGTHGAGEHEHAPSVDLWGILLDGIVVNDLVENTHVVGRSFCRAQTGRLKLLGVETSDCADRQDVHLLYL